MKRSTCIALLLVFSFLAGALHAQSDYPNRPVRIILPFGPGGASDFLARIVQPRYIELFGQQVVIDNRVGAAGNIGTEVAARASPDGYTVFLGNVGTISINPHLYSNLAFKPSRDFIAVTQNVDVPGALVVHPSLPVNNIKELVAYAKARPGKLVFGSAGAGSVNRLEMELFMRAAGLDMIHVPYKGGAGQAVTGIVGGETQLMFVTLSSAIGFVKGGRLRALGVVAPKRVPVLPDTPTLSENGFAMTTGSWQGIFVPAGTPRHIVNKWFDVTLKVMAHPDVPKRLAEGGVDVVLSKSVEDFTAFVKKEDARWARVIKEAKITLE